MHIIGRKSMSLWNFLRVTSLVFLLFTAANGYKEEVDWKAEEPRIHRRCVPTWKTKIIVAIAAGGATYALGGLVLSNQCSNCINLVKL